MPKYQIILESAQQLADDEFYEWAQDMDRSFTYKIIEARNLEGIREEVWQKPVVARKTTDISDLL